MDSGTAIGTAFETDTTTATTTAGTTHDMPPMLAGGTLVPRTCPVTQYHTGSQRKTASKAGPRRHPETKSGSSAARLSPRPDFRAGPQMLMAARSPSHAQKAWRGASSATQPKPWEAPYRKRPFNDVNRLSGHGPQALSPRRVRHGLPPSLAKLILHRFSVRSVNLRLREAIDPGVRHVRTVSGLQTPPQHQSGQMLGRPQPPTTRGRIATTLGN